VVAPDRLRTIADAIFDRYETTRARLHPDELKRHALDRAAFVDAFEDHGRDMLAPFVEQIASLESVPEFLGPLLTSMAGPEGFSASTEIVAAVAAVIFVVIQRIAEPMLQDLVNDTWHRFQAMPLSPPDVALNELRGGIYKGGGAGEASLSGVNPQRYAALLENTGEPPAIQEMLFLLRRGKVGAGDVEKAIRQSRVRDEWIGAVLDLTYGPPSSADAIGAAVRNLLSDGEAARIVAENGIDPANYDWLRASAGRPPGTEQMLQLLNRGVIDEGTVVQSIRESDIKDKYIGAILEMRRHLMPERTVVSAIGKGVFSRDEGIQHLLLLGFSPEDAAALASEASGTKVAAGKTLSVSLIVDGYKYGLETRSDAAGHLGELGYDTFESSFMLDVADAEVAHTEHVAAVHRVRTLFVGRHIDQGTARTDLIALGVPAAQADALLAVWVHEQAANVASLTKAELGRARKLGWLTDQQYLARVEALGYSPADAALLLSIAVGASNPAGT
jgi:hypothetical protein